MFSWEEPEKIFVDNWVYQRATSDSFADTKPIRKRYCNTCTGDEIIIEYIREKSGCCDD